MPRGDKSKYTDKQIRKAEHIEESYEERGAGKDKAERIAWPPSTGPPSTVPPSTRKAAAATRAAG
jgi:hypothetical protein